MWSNVNAWADSWAGCKGTFQSPIDFDPAQTEPCSQLCDFRWGTDTIQSLTLTDDPDLTTATFEPLSATYNGTPCTYTQFTFYTPAQHTVEGQRWDAELVFSSSDGGPHVSYLLQSSSRSSSSSDFFAWSSLATKNEGFPIQAVSPTQLLSSVPSYWMYQGSDLTPPCDGNKIWIVFQTPSAIGASDLAVLGKLSASGYRPTQSLGNRHVFANGGEGLLGQAPGGSDKLTLRVERLDENLAIQSQSLALKDPPTFPQAPPLGFQGVGKAVKTGLGAVLPHSDTPLQDFEAWVELWVPRVVVFVLVALLIYGLTWGTSLVGSLRWVQSRSTQTLPSITEPLI